MKKKKIDAAQLGKVNNTGSRLLGSAASVTSNKPALPDRTPDRNVGCRVAHRLQASLEIQASHGENGKNCWAVHGELLGRAVKDVSRGFQVSVRQQ